MEPFDAPVPFHQQREKPRAEGVLNDKEATRRFYEIVWPQMDVVLRYARMLTRSATEAEDLSQETLLKAFRAIGSFSPGTNVRAWLMTILRRTHVDRVRASAARPSVSLDNLPIDPPAEAPPAATDPADWHDAEAMLQQFSDQSIIDALKTLPDDMRWTLLLVDVEGLDLADAAQVLEVAVGTVKSRAHRARAMLKKALERQHGERDEQAVKSI